MSYLARYSWPFGPSPLAPAVPESRTGGRCQAAAAVGSVRTADRPKLGDDVEMMKADVMQSLKSTNLNLNFSVSPLVRWVLTIVILGAGIAVIAFLYTQEQSRNNQLQDQVDAAAATLEQNNIQMTDLNGQLAAANVSLTDLHQQADFPSSHETMDIQERLYQVAAASGVQVGSINIPGLDSAEGSAYQYLDVTVDISGPVANLLLFADTLGSKVPTAQVASCKMSNDTMNMVLSVYVEQ